MTAIAAESDRRPVVYVPDPIHPIGLERLSRRFRVLTGRDRAAAAVPEADALVVRSFPVTAAAIGSATRLKIIAKHGSGVDNIDLDAARRHGIPVVATPGGNNAVAVAEGAVALMLAVMKQVTAMDRAVRAGDYDRRWLAMLGTLTGATVGIVGFGRIGRRVAEILIGGFSARVVAWDPHVAPETIRATGAEPAASLADVLDADVVTIHASMQAGHRPLIGAPELAQMRTGAILINTARGGLVDEGALVAALDAGALGGAGIDVFATEPPPTDHPLFARPNVVVSPHTAGVTAAALAEMANAVATIVEDAFAPSVSP